VKAHPFCDTFPHGTYCLSEESLSRKPVGIVLTVSLTAGLLGGLAAPASASLSVKADNTWMTNGVVYSIVQSGNTIYLGGLFTRVSACTPNLSCPGESLDVSNLAALNATTGAAIPTFHPMVQGDQATVYALAVLGPRLFFGGQFTSVDGTARRNFAAVDLTTGVVDPSTPAAVGLDNGDKVRGMVATSSRVYISGGFGQVDGVPRKHLAAFDVNGTLDPVWAPRTDGQTHTVTMSCDGTSVIAAGGFQHASSQSAQFHSRYHFAIFDATNGALDPWTPVSSQLPSAPIYDLAVSCDRLYAGSGGSNRIMALDLTDDSGNVLWMLTTDGNAQAVALRGDRLLVGGHFTSVPLRDTNKSYGRFRFAVLDLDGYLQSDWVPEFRGTIHTGVWDILVTGSQIWVGGGFTTVSGDKRWCLARFTDTP
jgi:hypothetical protein